MPDLKYDTETMRDTATKYREIATTMQDLQKTLKKEIEDLKNNYWKSAAGTAFQEMYEEGWSTNVDKYVKILEEMARQLDKAANDYDDITVKLNAIEGVKI